MVVDVVDAPYAPQPAEGLDPADPADWLELWARAGDAPSDAEEAP